MSGSALLPMALLGLAAIAAGAILLLSAAARPGEAARYMSRLVGVMICAIGMILIVFAASWTFTSRASA